MASKRSQYSQPTALRAGAPIPVRISPSTATSLLDRLLLPGLLQFTRFGHLWRHAGFGPLPSLDGRTVVITGATSGLGRAAAGRLAAAGARVVLVGRDEVKVGLALGEIREVTPGAEVTGEVADLSLLSSVRALAGRLLEGERHIHVLINNAAVLENERRLTEEGVEVSLATNLLAPFLLTRLLVPALRRSAPSRIVNVVSGGMYLAGLDASVFGDDSRPWDGATAYARHKRALMTLTEAWAEELAADGIAVNAMHPGWAETPGVARSLPLFLRVTRSILRSAEEGADTISWLAAAPEGGRFTGALWLDREPHPGAVLPGTAGNADERRALLDELVRRTSNASAGKPASASRRDRAPRASRG